MGKTVFSKKNSAKEGAELSNNCQQQHPVIANSNIP